MSHELGSPVRVLRSLGHWSHVAGRREVDAIDFSEA